MTEFLYGGDWNPEQWDESEWEKDLIALRDAHINEVTINVFSWALLQPNESTYDFTMLDKIVYLCKKYDMAIVFATGTAALPAWLVRLYPEVMRTDENGTHHVFGGRHNFCPTSPIYRKLSRALAERIAQRYCSYPRLAAWHVGNEYGGGGGYCYCENCAASFRKWLQDKYETIDNLNRAWCANFWSHTIVQWDDIVPPVTYGDGISVHKSILSGMLIDYRRFQSSMQLECYKNERDAIRAIDAHTPITTNLMGTFKDLDYFEWGKELDIISWDNYPGMDTPTSYTAMCHDLMRGIGNGEPFMLMEQTPNQQNWFPYCKVKRPGEVAQLSWQAVAHGADTVQFFQMRQSLGGCERFHGAVISHDGSQNSRTYKEISALGSSLHTQSSEFLSSEVRSDVAVFFDWESYWSLEACVGPTSGFSYPQEVHRFYRALYDQNVSVDFVSSTTPVNDLKKYKMIVAPVLIMVKPGVAKGLEEFVNQGGVLVTGYMSGLHNEHDLVVPGGYPGELRKLCGIWVEEMDGLNPEKGIDISIGKEVFHAQIVANIISLEGAHPLALYEGEEFYSQTPAVTVNEYGQGTVYYVGAPLDDRGMNLVMEQAVECGGVQTYESPDGIEIRNRYKNDGSILQFAINTKNEKIEDYDPFEVRIDNHTV